MTESVTEGGGGVDHEGEEEEEGEVGEGSDHQQQPIRQSTVSFHESPEVSQQMTLFQWIGSVLTASGLVTYTVTLLSPSLFQQLIACSCAKTKTKALVGSGT